MKPLSRSESDALDSLFQGLPSDIVEAARVIYAANGDRELKQSAWAFQIAVGVELKKEGIA